MELTKRGDVIKIYIVHPFGQGCNIRKGGKMIIKKFFIGLLSSFLIFSALPSISIVFAEETENDYPTEELQDVQNENELDLDVSILDRSDSKESNEVSNVTDGYFQSQERLNKMAKAKFVVDTVRLNRSSLIVNGWALCTDPNARIEVVVDGSIVSYNINRIDRPDVNNDDAYGGAAANPKPGFKFELDKNFGEGSHIVEVRIVSNMNILAYDTRTITLGEPKATMRIDNLSISKDKLSIKGWSMSTVDNARIELVVDGKIVSTSLPRHAREDILNSVKGYGDSSTTPNPGFSLELSKRFTNGVHQIEVRTVSGLTILSHINETFIVESDKAKINIEKATMNVNSLNLQGWAMSTDPKARVEVVLDGKILSTSLPRTQRNDILNSVDGFGNKYTTPNPGFVLNMGDSYSIGNHQLEVRVVSSDMKILAAAYKTLTLGKPKAKLSIDNLHMGSKSVSLSGWAMSNDKNARVEVVVDGKILSTSLPRSPRADILANIKGYGDASTTPNPGFMYDFSNRSFTSGYHNVEVRVVSGMTILAAVYKQVKVEPYKAKLNVDNLSVTDHAIAVNGWAMSTDGSNRVEIVVDNKILTTAASRYTRADVLSKIIGYGSAETNGKAGFTYQTSYEFTPGNHRIEVRVVSGNNILDYSVRNIKVGPLKGIDVSEHNGTIDWKTVAKNIDFAILRAGWGYFEKDKKFDVNYAGASTNGIPIGIYYYSYALNMEEAKKEVDGLLTQLKGKNIQYPIFIDMEDADGYKVNHGMPSNQMLQDICVYFCERLTAEGYTAGVYANLNWWTNRLDTPRLDKYVKWIAQWNSSCTYQKPYEFWQYSSNGSVPGIPGRVDMNYAYKAY